LINNNSKEEFEARDRVGVKSIEGSVIATHRSIETEILEGSLHIPFRFQLTCWETEFWSGDVIASKVRNKDYYDKGTEVMKNEVGDKVLLYEERVRRGRSRKLSSK